MLYLQKTAMFRGKKQVRLFMLARSTTRKLDNYLHSIVFIQRPISCLYFSHRINLNIILRMMIAEPWLKMSCRSSLSCGDKRILHLRKSFGATCVPGSCSLIHSQDRYRIHERIRRHRHTITAVSNCGDTFCTRANVRVWPRRIHLSILD